MKISQKSIDFKQVLRKAFPEIRIAVTQPRRNAVMSVAKRMVFEQGWELGGEVGYYLARIKSPCSRKTKVVFQVDQLLVVRS